MSSEITIPELATNSLVDLIVSDISADSPIEHEGPERFAVFAAYLSHLDFDPVAQLGKDYASPFFRFFLREKAPRGAAGNSLTLTPKQENPDFPGLKIEFDVYNSQKGPPPRFVKISSGGGTITWSEGGPFQMETSDEASRGDVEALLTGILQTRLKGEVSGAKIEQAPQKSLQKQPRLLKRTSNQTTARTDYTTASQGVRSRKADFDELNRSAGAGFSPPSPTFPESPDTPQQEARRAEGRRRNEEWLKRQNAPISSRTENTEPKRPSTPAATSESSSLDPSLQSVEFQNMLNHIMGSPKYDSGVKSGLLDELVERIKQTRGSYSDDSSRGIFEGTLTLVEMARKEL